MPLDDEPTQQPEPAVSPVIGVPGQVRRNAVANMVSTFWALVLNLLFIPVYLRLLGVEAYGLVGFYATLQAALALLDLGITPTMARSMAQYSVASEHAQQARNMVRTFEVWYWALALFMGAAIASLSGFIANRWLNLGEISPATVQSVVLLMGMMAAAQWPASLYAGGLQGLQLQVRLGVIYIGYNTLRHVGAAAVLLLTGGSVVAFFWWQMLVGFGYTMALLLSFWRAAPGRGLRPQVSLESIKPVWRFALGMTGIALISVFQAQGDKILLSRMLPLREFAYYSLASTVASSLILFSQTINTAAFPGFAQRIAAGSMASLVQLFRQVTQLVTTTAGVVGLSIAVLSGLVLQIWLNNPESTEAVAPILTIMASSAICTLLVSSIFRLALAFGWTRINIYVGAGHMAMYLPLLLILTSRNGAIGAAWANLIATAIMAPLFAVWALRRLLPGHISTWLTTDVAPPLLAAAAVLVTTHYLLPESIGRLWAMAAYGTALAVALGAAALTTPTIRAYVVRSAPVATLFRLR
jgi:O-antigen/teichoic acid export membrane protein